MLVQCFSVVVGPNGSEKSIVIDVQFFLGSLVSVSNKSFFSQTFSERFSYKNKNNVKKYKDCIALFSRNFNHDKLHWKV